MAVSQTYLECLEALVQATEQVKTATEAADWDRVLACLAERQEVMDRIDAMPSAAVAMNVADRTKAISLLSHVASQDDSLASAVSEAMAATREAIGESKRTQQSISAYRKVSRTNAGGTEARFMDTQR